MKRAVKDSSQLFMSTVKVGPKGQIVIPKEVRDMFEIAPGDSLLIMADSKKGIALQRQNFMTKVASMIFDGRGKTLYPEEPEENLQDFANSVKETINSEE